jgi:hypothetical protein
MTDTTLSIHSDALPISGQLRLAAPDWARAFEIPEMSDIIITVFSAPCAVGDARAGSVKRVASSVGEGSVVI